MTRDAGRTDYRELTAPPASTLACRILAKLGLRDLVQVVVFAYDVGLVQPKARQYARLSVPRSAPGFQDPRR